MTVRTDVSIRFNLSPRIIHIAAPSTEITIQDLHDTLRALEDEPSAMQYPDLIETTGGQSLGGADSVGLTASLKNARIAFDARKTSVSAGSVTTTDLTGRLLIDSNATFVSDGVVPGAWLVNLSDGSVCTALVVLSETTILTDIPGDGSTNQWQTGDDYKIWNVVQVEVSGGNLVAVDESLASIDSVLPTAGTQVVRTSAASATSTNTSASVATALTVTGSTTSLIRTNIAKAASYYDGMLVMITDGEQSVVRRIDHQAADGTLYPSTALPFTPSIGAEVTILTQHEVGIGAVA
jgi:hypothetical protein